MTVSSETTLLQPDSLHASHDFSVHKRNVVIKLSSLSASHLRLSCSFYARGPTCLRKPWNIWCLEYADFRTLCLPSAFQAGWGRPMFMYLGLIWDGGHAANRSVIWAYRILLATKRTWTDVVFVLVYMQRTFGRNVVSFRLMRHGVTTLRILKSA